MRNCSGSSISLGVFCGKVYYIILFVGIWNYVDSLQGQRIREIYAQVPSDGKLGLSLQWTPLSATEDVWHILDVAPNSPADNAGLLPYGDYVIGSPEGLVRGEAGLGELVDDVSHVFHCH